MWGRRGAVPPPRVAVLTMVRDEGDMLRLWVRHYAAQVGVEHLLVLDDHSTDGSTDDLPCRVRQVEPLPAGVDYEPARMRLLSDVARELLRDHDHVVLADADEFIVADPRHHETLVDLLAARPDDDVLGVTALNVVHHGASEARLDLRVPILDQRSYAKFAPVMCKPAVKRVPAGWAHASHGVRARFRVDPELVMLHLKFADRDRLHEVSERRRAATPEQQRAPGSSWSRSGDDLVGVLDRVMSEVDVDAAPVFEAGAEHLAGLPRRAPGGVWRSPTQGQVAALRRRPLVRLPSWLDGSL